LNKNNIDINSLYDDAIKSILLYKFDATCSVFSWNVIFFSKTIVFIDMYFQEIIIAKILFLQKKQNIFSKKISFFEKIF